jgi:hypothetical protein
MALIKTKEAGRESILDSLKIALNDGNSPFSEQVRGDNYACNAFHPYIHSFHYGANRFI